MIKPIYSIIIFIVIISSLVVGVDVETDKRDQLSFSTPQEPISSVYATSMFSGEEHV
jgi:hypothetical protein